MSAPPFTTHPCPTCGLDCSVPMLAEGCQKRHEREREAKEESRRISEFAPWR